VAGSSSPLGCRRRLFSVALGLLLLFRKSEQGILRSSTGRAGELLRLCEHVWHIRDAVMQVRPGRRYASPAQKLMTALRYAARRALAGRLAIEVRCAPFR